MEFTYEQILQLINSGAVVNLHFHQGGGDYTPVPDNPDDGDGGTGEPGPVYSDAEYSHGNGTRNQVRLWTYHKRSGVEYLNNAEPPRYVMMQANSALFNSDEFVVINELPIEDTDGGTGDYYRVGFFGDKEVDAIKAYFREDVWPMFISTSDEGLEYVSLHPFLVLQKTVVDPYRKVIS